MRLDILDSLIKKRDKGEYCAKFGRGVADKKCWNNKRMKVLRAKAKQAKIREILIWCLQL